MLLKQTSINKIIPSIGHKQGATSAYYYVSPVHVIVTSKKK